MTIKISNRVLALVLSCMVAVNAAAMDKIPRLKLTEAQADQRKRDKRIIHVSEKMIVYVHSDHFTTVRRWIGNAKQENPSDGAILVYLSEEILQNADDGVNIQFDAELMDDAILKEFCSLQNKAAVTDSAFNFGALGALCNAICQASFGDAWIAFTAGLYCSKYADGDSPYQGMFEFSPKKAQRIADSSGIRKDS
ncbi:hypothetical protein FACS189449_00680 [Alphaproteobacteria bacterium]|nr:hypothetical protein FACS189449_00680 [Alphaproteobacteria bacterium]